MARKARRFRQSDVMRWVRVRFEDVGTRDELIVAVEDGGAMARTMGAYTTTDERSHVEHTQIIAFGPYVRPPAF